MVASNIKVEVERVHQLEGSKGLRAFVDIKVNDSIVIKGFRVMTGRNGIFVSPPVEKAKDNKWYEKVRFLDEGLKGHVSETILAACSL